MKTVPIDEKDRYAHIAVEDLGDGTCRLYEPGDEELLRKNVGEFAFIEPPQTNPRSQSREELRVREAHHVA